METLKAMDVAVIGGGPAGISACLEIAKSPGLTGALFDYEQDLGTIPRSCHFFFGFHDRRRLYSGPGYAALLDRLVRNTSFAIHTSSTVVAINPGGTGKLHELQVLSSAGLKTYRARCVLIATGCFESSRAFRNIGGTRPAGIFTTGALQRIVNICGKKPGSRAVVVGSEHVSFSSILTLRRAGMQVQAVIEHDDNLQTYWTVGKGLSRYFNFPIHLGSWVEEILGEKRVEGIVVRRKGDARKTTILCDTVILTGKFQPYSGLIDGTPVELDVATQGPVVDVDYETSVPNIFAAGNVLRGADMHGFCALEGKRAAKSILSKLAGETVHAAETIAISAQSPIRYVVPQRVLLNRIEPDPLYRFSPGCSFQVERTLEAPTVEAWSGDNRIWRRFYWRLIANHRTPLPLHRFDWQGVRKQEGITVRISK